MVLLWVFIGTLLKFFSIKLSHFMQLLYVAVSLEMKTNVYSVSMLAPAAIRILV